MHRIVGVALALVVMLVSGATSASANPGSGVGGATGSGYFADVTFSGDAAPAGGGTINLPVPATCWWEPAQLSRLDTSLIDMTSPDEIEAWYMHELPQFTGGSSAMGRLSYGDLATWKAALDKMRAGEKITVYTAVCRDSAPLCTLNGFAPIVSPASASTGPCGIALTTAFFGTGTQPEPQVAPADLAQVASEQMDIPDPQVDRNPKVTALAEATLVSLPTWFWVTDATSVGGTAGTRTIRAEIGAVWAEVVASTDGLHLSSPANKDRTCGPDKALTHYATGVSESSACTVSFVRSSVGYPSGFPVDASTSWSATWTGSGNTGGALAALQRGSVVDVPVAEVQTIVTDAG